MLEKIIILSLTITAIYVSLQPGEIFGWVRRLLATLLDKLHRPVLKIWILKPITDCLTCMGWFWTIIITWSFDIRLMLPVCGLNFIINHIFDAEPDPAE